MYQEIIKEHKPTTWATTFYNKPFEKFSIYCSEPEYQELVAEFQPLQIESIQRIQNPFCYGRFKLRKEQFAQRNQTIHEIRMYHPIRERDVDIVAEYNCDYRRYSSADPSQSSNKRPKFYKSPQMAKSRYGTLCDMIVVVRVLHTSTYTSEEITKDWDTEYIPEYAVLVVT